MKHYKTSKILFKNAHLIIDKRREYLSGALALVDGHIDALYAQNEKLYGDYRDYEIIDLKNHLLMPAFCDVLGIYNNAERLAKGIGFYGLDVRSKLHEDEGYLGSYLDGSERKLCQKSDFDYNIFQHSDTKLIFLDPSAANYELLKRQYQHLKLLWKAQKLSFKEMPKAVAGYVNPYAANTYESESYGLINLIFVYKESYKLLDSSKINLESFNDLWRLSSKEHLILTGDVAEQAKMLRKAGMNYLDLAKLACFNGLSLYDYDYSLLRGQEANLICVDKEMNLKFMMKGGHIYRQ